MYPTTHGAVRRLARDPLAAGRPMRRRRAAAQLARERLNGRRRRQPKAHDAATFGPPRHANALIGYTSAAAELADRDDEELRAQAEEIASECRRRGHSLLDVVRERVPYNRSVFERPGLRYALDRISSREADGLVVADLAHVVSSVAEMGELLEWFARAGARLLAVGEALDTAEPDGRLTAKTLIDFAASERERLGERVGEILQAAPRTGLHGLPNAPRQRGGRLAT